MRCAEVLHGKYSEVAYRGIALRPFTVTAVVAENNERKSIEVPIKKGSVFFVADCKIIVDFAPHKESRDARYVDDYWLDKINPSDFAPLTSSEYDELHNLHIKINHAKQKADFIQMKANKILSTVRQLDAEIKRTEIFCFGHFQSLEFGAVSHGISQVSLLKSRKAHNERTLKLYSEDIRYCTRMLRELEGKFNEYKRNAVERESELPGVVSENEMDMEL